MTNKEYSNGRKLRQRSRKYSKANLACSNELMKTNALHFLIYEKLDNSEHYEKSLTKADLRNQIEGKH